MNLLKRYSIWQLCLIAGVAFIPIAPELFTIFSVLAAFIYVIFDRKLPDYKWIHPGFILLSVAYFILNVIMAISADNQEVAWIEVQTKFSFLILPLLILTYWREFWHLRKILLLAFVAGNLAAGVYCWAHSGYLYLSYRPWIEHFYGPRFSVLIHLGYYAILLNSAIAMMYYLMWKNLIKRFLINYIIVGLLHILLFQLVSKNGLISLFFLDTCFALLLLMKYKSWKPLLISGSFTILIGIGAWYSTPYVRTRISEVFVSEKSNDDSNSTSLRKIAWDASIKVAKDNLLFGVGTGDVKDELGVIYKKEEETVAFEKKIDSHNQFLYTFVEHGLLGLTLICLMFMYSIFHAIKNRHRAFLIFNVSLVIPAVTESVFQTQAGVISYCFLWSFMFALMHGAGKKAV